MKHEKTHRPATQWTRTGLLLLGYLLLLLPMMAFAQDSNLAETQEKVCGVMGNIHTLLKVASIVIVTVAIIFAGYQIAFAHKRIADVAPILIGGLLIGASGQIAALMIGKSSDGFTECNATTSIMVIDQDRYHA